MDIIGNSVIWILTSCAVAGAVASIRRPDRGLGKEFLEGLQSIGHIFIPVAGIMASIPFLSRFVEFVFANAYETIGADKAMSATSFIAVDMGGYQLASILTDSPGGLMMAMFTGTMMGATVVFSIPVGLAMLEKRDHKYMALGILSGLLAIPVGIFLASILTAFFQPTVRMPDNSLQEVHLSFVTILRNLAPLAVLVGLLALGLVLFPSKMIRGFLTFGRGVDIAIKLILAAVIVQHSTKLFTSLFDVWEFDPILANYDQIKGVASDLGPDAILERHVVRALEVAGAIGLMLSGAFPMVYLIKKHLAGPMDVVGRKLGLSSVGAAGILASMANILAMFRLVKEMPAKDKVLNIAFAVCAAFVIGDHLAFTSYFQPNLVVPVMVGKLGGGIFAFWLAYRLSVPKALQLEKDEMDEHVEAICALLPPLQGKKIVFKRLSGGLTNSNYMIRAGEETYVLRISSPGTGLLGIDRQREIACSQAAAAAGVGPEVFGSLKEIAFLPGYAALLIDFCPGKTMELKDFSSDEVLHRVVQTLRRCHDHPAPENLASFSSFTTIRDYCRFAQERGVPLPADLPAALEKLGAFEKELASGEAPCLCHNDLLAGNFMDDGVDLRIIDWEYGGLGDRYFDLGNLAVNLQLDEVQERALLASYFGHAGPEELRRLRLMRVISDLREATWGFLQSRLSAIESPEYYLSYGRRHLDRFLQACRTL